ncbi:hypothetical protein K0T92_13935 [Paenibacillus oenotherae]|uniref:Uncharacterized protein n=1 Tax=Paenibacillus oenotherae TaxID=1435645 RepID=A0ABS7D8I5_9BACL|nr:hypothetical protein [Paenibacillus oenotherae]MBW7475842.1 hypothetical protein [Paenibacillus oenotherae]
MRKEHIVYFKVIHKGEASLLRGLLYLEEGQEPTLQDFEQCLRACGHDVRVIDQEQFIFTANRDGEDYTIDVIEDYEQTHRDLYSDSLNKTFIKKDRIL